jgi:hypothetical protein
MELGIKRSLQEIHYENRKFMVQMMAAVAGVALAFGVAIGCFARGGPLVGI